MADYSSPAVYVEELSSGVKPLEGAGTSTAGFVGHTAKGPVGVATAVNNFSEFERQFGGFDVNAFLPFAVKAFFDEGGRRCYVVRTCHFKDETEFDKLLAHQTFENSADQNPGPALIVRAISPGPWGDDISITIKQSDAATFQLKVLMNGVEAETFDGLSMDHSPVHYVETMINGHSQLIVVQDATPDGSHLDDASKRPKATTAPVPLADGADGLTDLAVEDFIERGVTAFDKIDDINIVAIPDAITRDVHVKGVAYCEKRQDCFYVADSQQVIHSAADVLDYKTGDGLFALGNAITSKYGALYAPWIEVFDPRSSGRIAIPPSGAVAGCYARVDGARGVHKAPAGIVDGKLNSALGVTYGFLTAEHEQLNPAGINLIRSFPGTGAVLWGARTVSTDPEWRYLNVRRLFIFLRESILDGTNWVVFEPNDRTLWKSIERNISEFLRLQWLNGALVGATPAEAFYVKCDDETNPPESIKLGRVITEIGVAPSKPAEFVIFRITQQDGGGGSTA